MPVLNLRAVLPFDCMYISVNQFPRDIPSFIYLYSFFVRVFPIPIYTRVIESSKNFRNIEINM